MYTNQYLEMTIADCAAGREKTANLEAINDPAFIILFVGMLVLEATTIRLCDMNCYPIPPHGYIPRENTTSGPARPIFHVLVNWKEKAEGKYGSCDGCDECTF